MTPQEIREACGNGSGNVFFRLSRKPRGERIRLTAKSGPTGYVICCGDNYTVAAFNAVAVLRWLDRMEGKQPLANKCDGGEFAAGGDA